tara:strand:- start:103 stop:285 length:183 start_codon:yes stop_codon:yes gene_type:complete
VEVEEGKQILLLILEVTGVEGKELQALVLILQVQSILEVEVEDMAQTVRLVEQQVVRGLL